MTITIGYARVSLNDDRQQLGLSIQLDALQHCDYVYKEKQSGYTDTREQFHKALSLACQLKQSRHEVTFVIYKLDRLTRKLTTLLQTLTIFEEYGIHLTSLQEQIDSQTLTGKFMCTLLGFVAEMELENIRARTKAGLAKAKANGIILGRPRLKFNQTQQIIELYTQTQLPVRQIAHTCQIAIGTIYNTLKRYNIPLRTK